MGSDSTFTLGPFAVGERIGRGGMGEIYRGVHREQGVEVAIKVVSSEAADPAVYLESFRNEVRAVASLDHPGVVLVLDYGEVPREAASVEGLREGVPYLVMEYAPLGSLDSYLGGLGWGQIRAVLLAVLDALAHAHARGVLHRDLKPQNILLGRHASGSVSVKLSDFGLAHTLGSFDKEGVVESGWGTPYYMAPEQFRGRWRDYGPWTDLYGLGCMAFELVCNRLPYEAATAFELGRCHIVSAVPPLTPIVPVPRGFDAWVYRLLQKEPLKRFRLAADAAWALLQLGDPEPDTGLHPVAFSGPGASPSRTRGLASDEWATGSLRPADSGTTCQVGESTLVLDLESLRLDDEVFRRIDHRGESSSLEATADFQAWRQEMTEPQRAALVQEPLPGLGRVVPPLPLHWATPQHAPPQAPPSRQLLGAGLGLFGLRRLRLVGRLEERDLLWQALRDVRSTGSARVVVLHGQPGTGKSELARWILERAHEVGAGYQFRAVYSPRRAAGDGLSGMMARHLGCAGLAPCAAAAQATERLEALGIHDEGDRRALCNLVDPQQGRNTATWSSVGGGDVAAGRQPPRALCDAPPLPAHRV